MIQSVDTYVYDSIKKSINSITQNAYMVKQIVGEMDKEARDNFISSYCGKNPVKEITVSYSFPQSKEQADARIVVQLGKAGLKSSSIGNIQGTYSDHLENYTEELCTWKDYDAEHIYLETEKPIGALSKVYNISFSDTDEMEIKDNKIIILREDNEELLLGKSFVVQYNPIEKGGEGRQGNNKGYILTQYIDVFPMSNNQDTARALDLLMSAIVIILAETDTQQTNQYKMENFDIGEMQAMTPDDKKTDMIIFSRPYTLSYTVTNTITYDAQPVNEYTFKERSR